MVVVQAFAQRRTTQKGWADTVDLEKLDNCPAEEDRLAAGHL